MKKEVVDKNLDRREFLIKAGTLLVPTLSLIGVSLLR